MQQVWDVMALTIASMFQYALLNPRIVLLTTVGLFSGIVLLIWVSMNFRTARRKYILKRGTQMTRAERIAYRKMLVATILTDGLEKAEEEGRLTRLEVQQLYRQVGKYLQNGELIPRRVHPDAIRNSILKKVYTAVKKEINIPGPKPGEGVNVVPFPVKTKRKFGEKYLAHERSTATA